MEKARRMWMFLSPKAPFLASNQLSITMASNQTTWMQRMRWDFVDITETQVPFTEACKANMVRVRAVELGDGIEIKFACTSKSGWVSVDSSEVALPPSAGLPSPEL